MPLSRQAKPSPHVPARQLKIPSLRLSCLRHHNMHTRYCGSKYLNASGMVQFFTSPQAIIVIVIVIVVVVIIGGEVHAIHGREPPKLCVAMDTTHWGWSTYSVWLESGWILERTAGRLERSAVPYYSLPLCEDAYMLLVHKRSPACDDLTHGPARAYSSHRSWRLFVIINPMIAAISHVPVPVVSARAGLAR
ncbi:hypothetical protein F5Y01DRAFT_258848 [Xylaria sp. FL0043]|nr:hypothetical protein F5Y01DRAFT_258848 [Xylaria sp. FL0043]